MIVKQDESNIALNTLPVAGLGAIIDFATLICDLVGSHALHTASVIVLIASIDITAVVFSELIDLLAFLAAGDVEGSAASNNTGVVFQLERTAACLANCSLIQTSWLGSFTFSKLVDEETSQTLLALPISTDFEADQIFLDAFSSSIRVESLGAFQASSLEGLGAVGHLADCSLKRIWLNAFLAAGLLVPHASIDDAIHSLEIEWLGALLAAAIGVLSTASLDWMTVVVLAEIEERSALTADSPDEVDAIDGRLDAKSISHPEAFSAKSALLILDLEAVGQLAEPLDILKSNIAGPADSLFLDDAALDRALPAFEEVTTGTSNTLSVVVLQASGIDWIAEPINLGIERWCAVVTTELTEISAVGDGTDISSECEG